MPWLKLNDGTVCHVKMSGMRKRELCSVCRRFLTDVLCDFRVEGQRRTCSAPLCSHCAVHVEPDQDFCPHHTLPAQQANLFGAAA